MMVEKIYVDTPPNLLPAASLNVIHHLKKLYREGRIAIQLSEQLTREQQHVLLIDDYAISAQPDHVAAADRAARMVDPDVGASATAESYDVNTTKAAVHAFGSIPWRLTSAPKEASL